jgi:hypothetical protein
MVQALPAAIRIRTSALDASLRQLGPRDAFCWRRFPSASSLPSTPSAAARPALFGDFIGTMELCDFLCRFIVGVRPWTSQRGPLAPSALDQHRTSRFSCKVFPYMRGASDRAGPACNSRSRCTPYCLPHLRTASASRSKSISRLNTRPALSPVNASTAASRPPPYDSGPLRVASPSTYDSSIHYTSPVYPGAREESPSTDTVTPQTVPPGSIRWLQGFAIRLPAKARWKEILRRLRMTEGRVCSEHEQGLDHRLKPVPLKRKSA